LRDYKIIFSFNEDEPSRDAQARANAQRRIGDFASRSGK